MGILNIFKRDKENTVEENAHPDGGGFNWLMNLVDFSSKRIRKNNATTFEDVYACINVLSDDIAKLPIKIYKKSDGKIEEVSVMDHSVAKVLKRQPNPYMTPSVWKKLVMVDICTDGNHYSLIKFDEAGQVIGLYPLTANLTRVVEYTDGSIAYETSYLNRTRTLKPHEVLHFKGLTVDGLKGLSPIQVISQRVEQNVTAVNYNSAMLAKGGAPTGVLKVQGELNRDAKNKVRDEWERINSKEAIAILDSGLEYQNIGISQKDLQYLESQRYNQQRIASIYKVPLHKLNHLERSTFSNIEYQSLEYVKNTLTGWLTMLEEEMMIKLFLEFEHDQGYYIKFNLDAELRGDSKTRAEVFEIELRNGLRTLDEIRALEERSPYPNEWGAKPFMTLNYTTIDMLQEYQKAKAGLGEENEDPEDPDNQEEDDENKGGEDNGQGSKTDDNADQSKEG